MKIGFVGTGQMGLPLCSNLVRAGLDVQAFDLSAAQLAAAVDAGAKPVESLSELGKENNVIVMSLPSPAASEAVITELSTNLSSGSVVIEMSTVSPGFIHKMAALLRDRGIDIVDCGMSGGPAVAQAGTLALMVGGAETLLERVRPALEAMGSHIVHCGATGNGMAAKLVNNALAHVNALAVCEAFSLGVKSGLDPKVIYDVVTNSSGNSWVLPARFGHYIETGEFAPGMKLDLLHKDSTLAMEMAHETGTPLFLMKQANSLFTWYQLEGLGGENWSKMMTVWEKQLGIQIGGRTGE
jgi:2-hydroxymethylglutarate dehydrogenase